jgi:glucose-6-phosphate 1-epimerase
MSCPISVEQASGAFHSLRTRATPYTGPMTVSALTVSTLNDQFGLPGILRFEEHGALTRAQVTLPTCDATVYLQGAHLTHWQPAGQAPVLFLSERSEFTSGKAIRGGVPICFPWFGGRSDGGPGPSHGFARIQPWELAFAALLPDSGEGDRLHLTFVLGPTALSRSLGYDDFRVACEIVLGRTLTLRLTVANFGNGPLRFEEALHTYFSIGDVRQTSIAGLESAIYLDKRDDGASKTAPAGPLELTGWTDRVFPANPSATTIHDPGNQRLFHIGKQHSATTVVWNPWADGAATLSDLSPEEWPRFVAVETANTGSDAITLAPSATHTMTAMISVEQA